MRGSIDLDAPDLRHRCPGPSARWGRTFPGDGADPPRECCGASTEKRPALGVAGSSLLRRSRRPSCVMLQALAAEGRDLWLCWSGLRPVQWPACNAVDRAHQARCGGVSRPSSRRPAVAPAPLCRVRTVGTACNPREDGRQRLPLPTCTARAAVRCLGCRLVHARAVVAQEVLVCPCSEALLVRDCSLSC